jgi:hypothetical protein
MGSGGGLSVVGSGGEGVAFEKLRSKPWARRPNWPKGRVNARALWTPALFNSALPLADYVSVIPASAANAAAARSFRFGFEPARKKTLAVSHRSLNAVFKAANGFLVRNLAISFMILKKHSKRPIF